MKPADRDSETWNESRAFVLALEGYGLYYLPASGEIVSRLEHAAIVREPTPFGAREPRED